MNCFSVAIFYKLYSIHDQDVITFTALSPKFYTTSAARGVSLVLFTCGNLLFSMRNNLKPLRWVQNFIFPILLLVLRASYTAEESGTNLWIPRISQLAITISMGVCIKLKPRLVFGWVLQHLFIWILFCSGEKN